MTGFIIVSGLPASGKSTIGRLIAQATGRSFIDKDDILESLFQHDDVDPDERSRLGRQADEIFIERAESLGAATLVSFWRQPTVSDTSGTPTEWLARCAAVVEVHCVCPVSVCIDRFTTRARHPGHGDHRVARAELERRFTALAEAGPVGIGRTITVDTSRPTSGPQLIDLAARL